MIFGKIKVIITIHRVFHAQEGTLMAELPKGLYKKKTTTFRDVIRYVVCQTDTQCQKDNEEAVFLKKMFPYLDTFWSIKKLLADLPRDESNPNSMYSPIDYSKMDVMTASVILDFTDNFQKNTEILDLQGRYNAISVAYKELL